MSNYTAIYRDVFNFHKSRAACLVNDESFFRETLREMTEISIKYNADPFVSELLLVVYGELERRANEQQV